MKSSSDVNDIQFTARARKVQEESVPCAPSQRWVPLDGVCPAYFRGELQNYIGTRFDYSRKYRSGRLQFKRANVRAVGAERINDCWIIKRATASPLIRIQSVLPSHIECRAARKQCHRHRLSAIVAQRTQFRVQQVTR